ncbi:MAG: hypothetical protein EON47_19305, partial [Acetobacteraceae bacterium]
GPVRVVVPFPPGAGMSVGSNGSGTSPHRGAEQFRVLAGLNAIHGPFRRTPQVMTDLLARPADWTHGNLPDVLPAVVRAAGVTADQASMKARIRTAARSGRRLSRVPTKTPRLSQP